MPGSYIPTPKNPDDFTQNVILMQLLETVSCLDEKVNSLTNKARAASVPTGLGNHHASIPSCCCHTICMYNNLNKKAPSDNTTHSPNPQQSYSGDNPTHVSNHPQSYSGDNTTHMSNHPRAIVVIIRPTSRIVRPTPRITPKAIAVII